MTRRPGATEAAWAEAPREPHWWESAGHFVAEIGRGAWEATAGLVELAWSISTVRMMVDPEGWERDVTALGEGLLYGVTHPVEFGKAHPRLGHLAGVARAGRSATSVPDLLIALADGGRWRGCARRPDCQGGRRAGRHGDDAAPAGPGAATASERLIFLERATAAAARSERPLPCAQRPGRVTRGACRGLPGATAPIRGGRLVHRPARRRRRGGGGQRRRPAGAAASRGSRCPGRWLTTSAATPASCSRACRWPPATASTATRSPCSAPARISRWRSRSRAATRSYGPGGFRQVFIPDMQRLIDDGVLEVAERRGLHTLQARIHVDAASGP